MPHYTDAHGLNKRSAADTRERILRAATAEFAAYGFAGARVGRIALESGANQRMIYAYYEHKAGLFQAVLGQHVTQAQEAVHMDARNLPGYAVALFDYYAANPVLVRLALWQELEAARHVSALPSAHESVEAKVRAIRQAQQDGWVTQDFSAGLLLDQVQALAVGNIVGHGVDWDSARRPAIAAAVARLVTPATADR